MRSRNGRNQRESFSSLRRLLAGLVRSMGKRSVRAALMMKLIATAVVFSMFAFGIGSTGTYVGEPAPPVVLFPSTTVASATTTVVPVTTTTTTIPVTSSPYRKLPDLTTPDNIIAELTTQPRSEIERIICSPEYRWSCKDALTVSFCESSHNPRAVSKPNRNGTIDRGLWQVNDVWEDAFPRSWGGILDPVVNTKMAYHIWKVGNDSFMYWTCQP